MNRTDPYTPGRYYYECRDCLQRIVVDEALTDCPDCGGRVRNIAVPRE